MKFILSIFVCFGFIYTNEIPPTNLKVIEYVNSVTGKKVGRGECWDLANEALNYANAKWEPPFEFGKKIDYKKEEIIPGDIIHINDLVMESRVGNAITKWKMTDHTAVLFEVKGEGKVMIAEQNVNKIRMVMINEWNLNDVKSGKLQFYRPQPN